MISNKVFVKNIALLSLNFDFKMREGYDSFIYSQIKDKSNDEQFSKAIQDIIITLIAQYDISNNIQDEIKQYITAKQYFILGDEYSQYYVSNYYQNGDDGVGPQFWYDERPLNESGYLEFQIGDISNKINPYSSIIGIS